MMQPSHQCFISAGGTLNNVSLVEQQRYKKDARVVGIFFIHSKRETVICTRLSLILTLFLTTIPYKSNCHIFALKNEKMRLRV